jgi:hypothetical protein
MGKTVEKIGHPDAKPLKRLGSVLVPSNVALEMCNIVKNERKN